MIFEMRRYILVDIDHTIANSFWRDHMIGGPWDEYHAASVSDKPVYDVANFLLSLQTLYEIVGLTARPGKWRQLTMDWLVKHSIPMDELLMRPDSDFRPAPELKLALALERFPDIASEVAFIMDDREDVVAAFKALGITAMQVHARQK